MSEKMNTALAIIPAHSGSQSIPRKNVRPPAGKPLIAHTIEQAHQAHSIDQVIATQALVLGTLERAPYPSLDL